MNPHLRDVGDSLRLRTCYVRKHHSARRFAHSILAHRTDPYINSLPRRHPAIDRAIDNKISADIFFRSVRASRVSRFLGPEVFECSRVTEHICPEHLQDPKSLILTSSVETEILERVLPVYLSPPALATVSHVPNCAHEVKRDLVSD